MPVSLSSLINQMTNAFLSVLYFGGGNGAPPTGETSGHSIQGAYTLMKKTCMKDCLNLGWLDLEAY